MCTYYYYYYFLFHIDNNDILPAYNLIYIYIETYLFVLYFIYYYYLIVQSFNVSDRGHAFLYEIILLN